MWNGGNLYITEMYSACKKLQARLLFLNGTDHSNILHDALTNLESINVIESNFLWSIGDLSMLYAEYYQLQKIIRKSDLNNILDRVNLLTEKAIKLSQNFDQTHSTLL